MAWTRIAGTSGSCPDGSAAFSCAAIDTTGADLIVIGYVYAVGTAPNVGDNKSNTLTPLTEIVSDIAARLNFYYIANPTVGTNHIFSENQTNRAGAMIVEAWQGAVLASVFDQQNGNASFGDTTTLAISSITPTEDNELVVAVDAWGGSAATSSIGSGFTERAEIDYASGQHYGVALATKVQTTAQSENPTATLTDPVGMLGKIASFKMLAVTPPATTLTWLPRQLILRGPRGLMTPSGPVPPITPEA